jgi:hypothetical protein
MRIQIEGDPDGTIAAEIEGRLIEALRRNVPSNDSEPITLVARDGPTIIGGLIGSTSYGWLLVKVLWVAEEMRCRADLMAQAEALARARGCHGVWLDTSSADAERFYVRLGYKSFGFWKTSGMKAHPDTAVLFWPSVSSKRRHAHVDDWFSSPLIPSRGVAGEQLHPPYSSAAAVAGTRGTVRLAPHGRLGTGRRRGCASVARAQSKRSSDPHRDGKQATTQQRCLTTSCQSLVSGRRVRRAVSEQSLLTLFEPIQCGGFRLKWPGENADAVIVDDVDSCALNAIVWRLEVQQLHCRSVCLGIAGG